MTQNIEDIQTKFDKKVKELEETLPNMTEGISCAELTLTSVLEILGVDNYLFHNIAKPLGGGFGGYKSQKGWMGACGAVTGGCAAIGAIMGGKEKMDPITMAMAYPRAKQFCDEFEKQFGSVVCSDLCGYDFSTPEEYLKYRDNDTWRKTCYKFVIWAVDNLRKLNRSDLEKKWE